MIVFLSQQYLKRGFIKMIVLYLSVMFDGKKQFRQAVHSFEKL